MSSETKVSLRVNVRLKIEKRNNSYAHVYSTIVLYTWAVKEVSSPPSF